LGVDTRDGCIVHLENVSRNYEGPQVVNALQNVTLSIGRGERVAFVGPSGSGKSTLLNLICGLDEATSGVVMFQGVDLSKLDEDSRTRLRREKIGMIFQSFNLMPTLSAVENVSLPLRLGGVGKRDADKRAAAMLERVGLKDRAAHRPDEMSGGERQRVAIARALILRPPLLLADEPTGNLDSATGGEILTLLDDLHREYGTTILLVTHNKLAAENCGRVLTMRDGMIAKEERKESFASEAR
jgi:putative ABC transport system ATP-binding protein